MRILKVLSGSFLGQETFVLFSLPTQEFIYEDVTRIAFFIIQVTFLPSILIVSMIIYLSQALWTFPLPSILIVVSEAKL